MVPPGGRIYQQDSQLRGCFIGRDAEYTAHPAAIELGDLTAMYVICQVFQGDMLKLKPGMKATIKSSALDQSLAGTVEEIGRVIDTKAQLGEAKIRLDDARLPSRLVGMEVEVQIAR